MQQTSTSTTANPLLNEVILKHLNNETVRKSIYRAIIEISTESPFNDVISHIHSMGELIHLHPRQDHLLLESITILINRGCLALHDPYILIRMAESIKEHHLKEEAISNIALQIAKIGVSIKNRDYLQQGCRSYL